MTSPPLPLPLDDDGLLDPSAFDALAPGPSYLVFAQQPDARIDLAAWQRHAAQFFATEVALTRPKRYGAPPPTTDAAHVVLTPRGEAPILRSIFLRPRSDDDLHAAERAEGGGGLALVAKRCPMVVLVAVEGGAGDPDAGSMGVAALLASVLLGPLMPPDRKRIVGPKTARQELEKRKA